ncbi:hypothetical protein AAZX31_12G177700 [Glycine max]
MVCLADYSWHVKANCIIPQFAFIPDWRAIKEFNCFLDFLYGPSQDQTASM